MMGFVKIFLIIMLVIMGLFLRVSYINAETSTPPMHVVSHQVKVSATVPLSDMWADAIAKKSNARVIESKSLNNQSIFSVKVIGLDEKPMKDQQIQAYVSLGDALIDTLHGKTDKEGVVYFTFTPKEQGQYDISFLNDTYERKVTLKDSIRFTPPTLVSTIHIT
jgi:hypothetical protein